MTGRTDWVPEALSRGTVSDWLGGRALPTTNKLLTFLVVCGVAGEDVGRWLDAVELVRQLPTGSSTPAHPHPRPLRRFPARRPNRPVDTRIGWSSG